MPEIKVECDCGQRYAFDVEPVHGRMPHAVNCPACGLDGTQKANAILKESALPAAPAPSALTIGAAPAPSTMAPPPPVAPPGPPRLRIGGMPSHAPAGAPTASAAPSPAAIPAPKRFVPGATLPAARQAPTEAQPRVLLGVIGAVVGGFIGMMAWYWLIKATGYAIGYAAWGVGVLAGISARLMSRGGSPIVGAVAAVCTLVAILGGQFLFASDIVKSELGSLAGLVESLKENMEKAATEDFEAKEKLGPQALEATTDEQIKELYKKIYEEAPDAEELAEFKEKELPQMRDIASGKLTKKQFLANFHKEMGEIESLDFKARWAAFKETVKPITILFLLLGVSSAFKIGMGSNS